MAKYEAYLTGDFNSILQEIETEILEGSISATLEDGSDYQMGRVYCAVRVFERYSMFGGNRVSLSVTLLGDGPRLFISAIAAAGSQATFFKVNTLGEESFLDQIVPIIQRYQAPM